MAPRISFSNMFTRAPKLSPAKELKGGPSGKEESKLQNTSKGDPHETAKGKNDAGEVKKERVTLRQLLDKERKEEELARKAKLQQPEVKEERKSAGSQSPESLLLTSQIKPRVFVKRKQFNPFSDALPTIPEKRGIVYEADPRWSTKEAKNVYDEVHPVKPEGPVNKFGLSTIHEDSLLADKNFPKYDPPEQKAASSTKEKGSNNFVQTFKSAMQGFSKFFTGSSSRSTNRN